MAEPRSARDCTWRSTSLPGDRRTTEANARPRLSSCSPTASRCWGERRPVQRRAKEEEVKVYTVGIGQRGTTTILRGGQPVRLDERTLQNIAHETGGEYFYAAEAGELEQVYQDLGSQVSWVEERTEITALVSALGTLFVVAGGLLGLRWVQSLP